MLEAILFAQTPPPTIDGAYLLGVLSRVVHTSCGAVLLGGAIYLRFVLAPAVEAADSAEATLFAGRRKAWAGCVGAAAGLILLSGFYNYLSTILTHEKMNGGYHAIVGVKMILALVVIALSSLIAGKTGAAEKLRAGAKKWLSLLVAATLAIFLLAAVAKSFPHLPKTTDSEPTTTEATT